MSYFKIDDIEFNNWKVIVGKILLLFLVCDWCFNEFFNFVVYVFYVIWVELMVLFVKGLEVGEVLFDVIFKGSYVIYDSDI